MKKIDNPWNIAVAQLILDLIHRDHPGVFTKADNERILNKIVYHMKYIQTRHMKKLNPPTETAQLFEQITQSAQSRRYTASAVRRGHVVKTSNKIIHLFIDLVQPHGSSQVFQQPKPFLAALQPPWH